MTKTRARAWARQYAGNLLRNFNDTDTVNDDEAGNQRSDRDIKLLHDAIMELAHKLDPQWNGDGSPFYGR